MQIIIQATNLDGGKKDELFLSSWSFNDRIVIRAKDSGFVVSKAELKKAITLIEDWDLEFLLDTQSVCID